MVRGVDHLAMLLSTDWFLPHWGEAGLVVDAQVKIGLQQDCRKIVRDFIGDSPEYWLISFPDSRIVKTNQEFMTALRLRNLDERLIGWITDIVIRVSENDPENHSMWLVGNLTQQLLARRSSSPTGLSAVTEGVLGDMWRMCEPKVPDLGVACRQSSTEWDSYIRGLTPDAPTMLADYAAGILRRKRVLCYWRAVDKTLSAEEKAALIRWYAAEAAALSGEPLVIPSWMK